MLLHVESRFTAACVRSSDYCHCVRLKDCEYYAQPLLHHRPEERDGIFATVRDAVCGFQGLDTLVCCPPQQKLSKHFSRNQRFVPPEHRWVWDTASSARSHPHEIEMRLHDYHDFHAQRNCPQPVDDDFEATYFGFNGVQHVHYHVQHEHKRLQHSTTRPPPRDRPIVFPGDLRFHNDFATDQIEVSADEPREQIMRDVQPRVPVAVTSTPARSNPPDCGISLSTRLLGGQPVSPGQYPWMARIAYRNRTSGRISYRCSGSLIFNNFVVTAAHCVVNLVADLEDCAASAANCSSPNLFNIERVIVHPNYDQPKYANDIALLGIRNNQSQFTAICLPLNSTAELADRLIGQTGVVAGWSSTVESNSSTGIATSTSARFIRLPIVNTTSCAITYASLSENFQQPIVITPRHLCAQGQPMNDVCRGDSGGPFMDDGTSGLLNANGRHTLLGIVAFGPTLCGVSTVPGVYTAVSAYTNWIYDSIDDSRNR
ncbi:hypothetical protein KR222_011785, partial [Zaprionus bogoriensis]